MSDIAFAKGHEEMDAFVAFDVFDQRFHFLIVEKIHVFLADLIKGACFIHAVRDRNSRNFIIYLNSA